MLDDNETLPRQAAKGGNSIAMGFVVVLVAAVMVPTILVLAFYYWTIRTLRATSHRTVAFMLSQATSARQ